MHIIRNPCILVTGGAGYIGRALTQALLLSGYSVTVLDDLSTGDGARLSPEVQFIRGDVANRSLVRQILRQDPIDLVIHLAARTQAMASFQAPTLYMAKNVVATQRLIEAIAEEGPRPLLLASTAAVYGDPAQATVTETFHTAPQSPYGVSKLLAEGLLCEAGRRFNLPWLALRYFNVAGGDAPELDQVPGGFGGLFPTARAVAEGRQPYLSIYGRDHPTTDGACVRDYINIKDLVQAHIGLIPKLLRGEICGVANLGSGCGVSVLEVVAAFERRLGRPLSHRWAAARAGEASAVVADIRKLSTWLPDWRPEASDLDALVASALAVEDQISKGQINKKARRLQASGSS